MTLSICPYCVGNDAGQHVADCPNNPEAETMTADPPRPTFPVGPPPLPPLVSLASMPPIPPSPPLESFLLPPPNQCQCQKPLVVEWATGRGEVVGFVRRETGTTYAIVNCRSKLREVALSELTVVED